MVEQHSVDYQIREVDGRGEVALSGRLTFDDNPTFRLVVENVGRRGGGTVVVDLAKLDFIDSAGLGMLMLLHEAAEAAGGGILLREPHGQVRRLITASRFDSLVPIQDWDGESR